MHIDGWRYYNHAAIPTTAPHEEPHMSALEDGSIWKIDGGTPLLARWTTDFDCPRETNWWYVIKDTPFDINALKAKRRYEINKGIKNFSVTQIEPSEYSEVLYEVQVAAYSAYPEKYRPTVDKEAFLASVEQWSDYYICLGAFNRETQQLCGYTLLIKDQDGCIGFDKLRADPAWEKSGINAALTDGVLTYCEPFLHDGWYVCDGARSINHETAFQDYLEKYFGFRKAYCKLHITYNPKLKWAIRLLYPFRKLLLKLDVIGIVHQLNSVLRMEEMVRNNHE